MKLRVNWLLFIRQNKAQKQDEGTCLFLRATATCRSYLIICSHFNEDGVD